MNYNVIGHICPETGRQCISAITYYLNHIDEFAYQFSIENAEFGLDPWTLIDSSDISVDGTTIDLWFASGRCITVSLDFPIYVR